MSGNIVSHCTQGILLNGAAIASGNAILMNQEAGFVAASTFTGVIDGNNIIGNGYAGSNCGVNNTTSPGVIATRNYWGAPGGPGAAPADGVCGFATTTSGFVKKPFAVKILKP